MINNFSELIRSRRRELKMTQSEVATATGVTTATVSKWERGDISNIKRDKIKKLAKLLDINPAEFFGYSETPDTPVTNDFKPVPVYTMSRSISKSKFFDDKNISHYIVTERSNIKYAVLVDKKSTTCEETREGDILLISPPSDTLNNTLSLVIYNNKILIARLFVTAELLAIKVDDKIDLVSPELVLGTVKEVRREII